MKNLEKMTNCGNLTYIHIKEVPLLSLPITQYN